MRILLVGPGRLPIPPPGYGGIERYLYEYGRALERAGHSVRILNGVRPGVYSRGWTFERQLPHLLRSRTEEIVHAHVSRAGVVLGLAGIPFVYTTHNPDWFAPRGSRHPGGLEGERFAVRFAEATVAFSDRLRTRVEGVGWRRGPVLTIPLGVDTEQFRASGPGDPAVALGVGEVAPRKRWHLAARALHGSSVRLTVVGPIRDRAYASQLEALGSTLTGELTEEALLRAFDGAGVVVHPSDREALPGAVLQGLSFGRPVVGGATIASIEGVLAAPSDDPATVEAFIRGSVDRLGQDPSFRAAVGRRARESAEQNYAWGAIVRAHLTLYERVLARSRS